MVYKYFNFNFYIFYPLMILDTIIYLIFYIELQMRQNQGCYINHVERCIFQEIHYIKKF